MATEFMRTVLTPAVRAAEQRYYGREYAVPDTAPERDALTEAEVAFIAERDSFYLATVAENGWPYVQHRGGPKGFLRTHGPRQLMFGDFGGNRQLISVGNLATESRVCLFLMNYPARERLKVLGHARVLDAREHPDLARAVQVVARTAPRVERIFMIDVLSFDWNCPKFITPRFDAEEVESVAAPLRQRIAQLEAALAAARK